MFVIHARLIVFMAQNALKDFVIGGIHMARGAGLPPAEMLAGINAEVLRVVVKGRGHPGVERVAGGAIMREIQGHMIRIRRPLKIELMAGKAVRGRARETVVEVALIALCRSVRAGQGKTRAVMIERRRLPDAGGMARRAILREIPRHVVGIGGALIVRLMARKAIHGRAGVTIVGVAQIA